MLELDCYLSRRRDWIETELGRRLPTTDARPMPLSAALRHAVMVGGKRLRPILCLAAAEAAGGQAETALPAALAVELLHGYTLVHDDLPCMDDDVERRGQPTVHVVFGEAVAVLTGDRLQAMAFELLAETHETRPGILAAMLRALGRAAGGVVAGQVEDIRRDRCPDRATVAYVHEHKTADLFEAALRLGALAVGGAQSVVEHLGRYGHHLGMAFQLRDDLLDDPAEAAPDLPPELNCLSVMTAAEARALAADHTRKAIARLDACPGEVEPMRQLAERLINRTH